MSSVEEKLGRGFELLGRAGRDADLLGMALVAFHGGLESYLDTTLGRMQLTPDERAQVDGDTFGWLPRARMAVKYGLLNAEQQRTVLEANRQRQEVAHGSAFSGTRQGVESYGTLVADLTGAQPAAPQTAARPTRQPRPEPERPTRQPRAASESQDDADLPPKINPASRWDDRTAVRRKRRPSSSLPIPAFDSAATVDLPGGIAVPRIALYGVGALLALGLIFVIFSRLGGDNSGQASSAFAQTPIVTPAVIPTPAPRRGTIVNLGNATGYLHQQPTFASPTMPPPVTEAMPVTLIDTPTVEADGTIWVEVELTGYRGWVPQTNVQIDSAASTAVPLVDPTKVP